MKTQITRLLLLAALACIAAELSAAEPTGAAGAYVRVSPRDARYFELSDGSPYIPIGLNLITPPSRDRFDGMADWLDQLAAHGGNFIRVWLSQAYFEVEPARSGEFDPKQAERIRQMLAFASQRGIRVKLCLEHFRHLGDGRQTWAGRPLHLVANGGTATNIADFFNGSASRAAFTRKLDWYAEQIGSLPAVFGWELWNEVNAVQGGDYMAWTEFMLPELKRRFPQNLCMQSLGSFDTDGVRSNYRHLALMPGNEVAQVHRYLDLGASLDACKGPVDVLAAEAVRELLVTKPNRPVILAESGAVEPSHSGPFKLYDQDTNGMILHDVLFAPFFAGAAGPGHIWHWDRYVANQKLWWHFGRFAAAVKGIDPAAERFEPSMLPHPQLRIYALKGRQTLLIWFRDIRNTWQTELAEGKAPSQVDDLDLDLAPVLEGAVPANAQSYDPWADRWASADLRGAAVRLPAFARSLVLKVTVGPDRKQ